jgi:membrane fusion protein, multidrug efflux system
MNGNGRYGQVREHDRVILGEGSDAEPELRGDVPSSATGPLEEGWEQVSADAAWQPSHDGAGKSKTKSLMRRRPVVLGMAAIVLAAVGVAGGSYYGYATSHESTDDAFIEGRIIQISPKVAGQVVKVYVTDNQVVKQGALLLEIDPRDFEAKLAQARANLAATEAQADLAHRDAQRFEKLLQQNGVSRQDRDTAVAKSRTATAQIAQLEAAVRQAELDLSYTKIVAPEAGRITRKSVESGSYVQVGQALLALVPRDFWVVANFKETQLTRMRPGQPVEITMDAYPGERLKGHVDSIQSGAGARFSLLPPENATGNYVKVVQRVPVKILFDETPNAGHPLGPGMSVEPTVKVK